MTRLEAYVDEIRRNFKLCGSIVFWGGLMVRPADRLFTLKDVRVSGPDSLLLSLKQDDGEERQVEIWNPAGLQITDDGVLRIKTATRLRLDDAQQVYRPADRDPALELS